MPAGVHEQQVSAFMLKQGWHFQGKNARSMRYLRWLQEQQLNHPGAGIG
jgi:transposase